MKNKKGSQKRVEKNVQNVEVTIKIEKNLPFKSTIAAAGDNQICKQFNNFDQPLFSVVSLTTGIKNCRTSMTGERITSRAFIGALALLHSSPFIGLRSKKNSLKRPTGR